MVKLTETNWKVIIERTFYGEIYWKAKPQGLFETSELVTEQSFESAEDCELDWIKFAEHNEIKNYEIELHGF